MTKRKFKIDMSGNRYAVFGLFIERIGWFGTFWEQIEIFDTRDKALESYEKIKNLPEYL